MDAVKFLLAFVLLIAPFAIAHLWYWVWFWMAIALVLITVEVWSVKTKNKTISGQFWEFKKKHPKTALACVIGISVFFMYLVAHLTWGI